MVDDPKAAIDALTPAKHRSRAAAHYSVFWFGVQILTPVQQDATLRLLSAYGQVGAD
jgi:hypothetical protein